MNQRDPKTGRFCISEKEPQRELKEVDHPGGEPLRANAVMTDTTLYSFVVPPRLVFCRHSDPHGPIGCPRCSCLSQTGHALPLLKRIWPWLFGWERPAVALISGVALFVLLACGFIYVRMGAR